MSQFRTKDLVACAAGAVFLVAAGIAMFSPPELFSRAPPSPPKWQASGPHQRIQPMNPDVDKETLRILNRDALFGLTSIQMYKLKMHIEITKNPISGKNIGFSVHLDKGNIIDGKADESGNSPAFARLVASDGSLMISQERIDNDTMKTVVPMAGGAEAVEIQTAEQSVLTIRKENGQPMFEVIFKGLRRTGLKLYSDSGRLIYSDVMTVPFGIYGQPATFEGTVYGPPNGQPTHKLTFYQYTDKDSTFRLGRIDSLAEDGETVSSTATVKWDDENQIPLSGFQSQADLSKSIQEAITSARPVMETRGEFVAAVMLILADRSH